MFTELEQPRMEQGRAMQIAGLSRRYGSASSAGIPAQWQQFMPRIGKIPGQVGNVAYGVCGPPADDGEFDYLSGVEVSDSAEIPAEFTRLRIPEGRYAVFTHRDHISTIQRTHDAIWSRWLPASEHSYAHTPSYERYDEKFDPTTGTGEVEIWVPIEDR